MSARAPEDEARRLAAPSTAPEVAEKGVARPPGAHTDMLIDRLAGPALPVPVFDPVAARLDTGYLNRVVRHPGLRAAAETRFRLMGRFHTTPAADIRDLKLQIVRRSGAPAARGAAKAIDGAIAFWREAALDGSTPAYTLVTPLWVQPGVSGPPSTAAWLVVGLEAHGTRYRLRAIVLDGRDRVWESLDLAPVVHKLGQP